MRTEKEQRTSFMGRETTASKAQGEMKMKMCLHFNLMQVGKNTELLGRNLTCILVNSVRRGPALRPVPANLVYLERYIF